MVGYFFLSRGVQDTARGLYLYFLQKTSNTFPNNSVFVQTECEIPANLKPSVSFRYLVDAWLMLHSQMDMSLLRLKKRETSNTNVRNVQGTKLSESSALHVVFVFTNGNRMTQTLCVFAINEPGFFCLLGDCINHYSLEVLGAVVSNRHKVQIAIF